MFVAARGGGGLVGTISTVGAAVGVAVQPITKKTDASAQMASQRDMWCLIATSKENNFMRGEAKRQDSSTAKYESKKIRVRKYTPNLSSVR